MRLAAGESQDRRADGQAAHPESARNGNLGAVLNIVQRWLRIRHAKREIAKLVVPKVPSAKILSTPGASFTSYERIYFVIATDTEEETNFLLKDYPTLYSRLCEAMARVGFSREAILSLRFPIISQQTIDRDFGGNWREFLSGQ